MGTNLGAFNPAALAPKLWPRPILIIHGEQDEIIDVAGISGAMAPRSELECTITRADGSRSKVKLLSRLDTRRDVDYFRHGGLLHYVLRHRLSNEGPA